MKMRIAWASCLVVLGWGVCATGALAANGSMSRTLGVDGLDRRYRLYVPSKAGGSLPAVIVLHGGGGNAQQMERYARFDDLAEKEGFVVLYPEAVEGHWNDGRDVGFMRAQRDKIDDVKFLRQMVEDAARQTNIDRTRVFATGISNGGFMSHRLAAEASDLVAGIAPVVGGMAPAIGEKFHPEFPVSVFIIQGDSDPIVPLAGGDVVIGKGPPRGKTLATRDILAKYVARNGNPGTAQPQALSPAAKDETSVEATVYAPGEGGAKTQLYVIKGGGHAWPGGIQYLPAGTIGKASQALSATEAIWKFFQSCPSRAPGANQRPR